MKNNNSWLKPPGLARPKLYLFNSLTRQKEEFIPHQDVIKWYSCGPTTYDDSHMGHARSYISFDILRRVIQDYFGYPIFYVMNITDIDDKIIKRARIHHLLEEYKKNLDTKAQFVEDLPLALLHLEKQIVAAKDADKRVMLIKEIEKVKISFSEYQSLSTSSNCGTIDGAYNNLLNTSESIIGDWLDFNKGQDVSDNSIFMSLPRRYEEEFHKDMEALNVLPADVVTRVSDYIPEIINFVQKIIDNGYAYESNSSVYFDVSKFHNDPNHTYAKLVPEAYGDEDALEEGEGVLSVHGASDKRSANDFALWKASKAGEPSWESPWGRGRPGWHIECSAMAGVLLGETLDLHTGGVDLKFPHHDNEIAQSEAFFNCGQWVNYFLHTGHLHIDGCKMSKSLKNFITIKKALEDHSPPQIRLAFLLHSWNGTLDYSVNTIVGAKQYLKMVTEFGLNVTDTLRRCDTSPTQWGPTEIKLNAAFDKARVSVHECLCDSVDTKGALDSLRDLVTETNKYMSGNTKFQMNDQLLKNAKNFVFKMLNIFGVPSNESTDGSKSSEDLLRLAGVVGEVRERLRSLAKEKDVDATALRTEQLHLCDEIRDLLLPPLGIKLEDRDQGSTTIKIVNPEELLKEIQEKKATEAAKRAEKEDKKATAAAARKEKTVAEIQDPSLLFKTDQYAGWDEKGIPTLDKDGKEITKSQSKKLIKIMEAHKKKYDKWKALQSQ